MKETKMFHKTLQTMYFILASSSARWVITAQALQSSSNCDVNATDENPMVSPIIRITQYSFISVVNKCQFKITVAYCPLDIIEIIATFRKIFFPVKSGNIGIMHSTDIHKTRIRGTYNNNFFHNEFFKRNGGRRV